MIKLLLADLARPFAIYSTSFAASWATVEVARKVTNGGDGAMLLTAVYGGVAALFIGKAFELTRIAGHSADVEKERAKAYAPPVNALGDPSRDVEQPEEKPPWER